MTQHIRSVIWQIDVKTHREGGEIVLSVVKAKTQTGSLLTPYTTVNGRSIFRKLVGYFNLQL